MQLQSFAVLGGILHAANGPAWAVAATAVDGSGSGFARSRATAGGLRQLQDYIEGNVYGTVAVDDVPSEQTDEPAEATDEPAEGIDTPKDYTEPAWIPLTSEDPDEPPEDPYEPPEDPYEPPEHPYEDGPYADIPGPAPAEATEESQVPGEAPEQDDNGMPPLPMATDSVAEVRPVWYRSVEDGGYQTTLGHGYDFWEIQVNRQFSTRPQLYTKDPVFDLSAPGGGCGPQAGLHLAVPCGVRITPIEHYNATILDSRSECRDEKRLTFRGAGSRSRTSAVALTIYGNAEVEYEEYSKTHQKTEDVVATATFEMYEATISRASRPPFTAAFLRMASDLPPNFTDDHMAFVRTFGTYFVEKVTMGVLQADYYRLDTQAIATLQETGGTAEAGIRFILKNIFRIEKEASEVEESYRNLRNSVVDTVRYGIDPSAPAVEPGQAALEDPANVDPKPLAVTLKPIENLFRSEFRLPKEVQSQYANIALAARRTREEAPEPVTASPAVPDAMEAGPALYMCSVQSGATRPAYPSLGYLLASLSLAAAATVANV